MALSALNCLRARVRNPLPDDLVAIDLGQNDLSAGIIVKTSHEVHVVSNSGQSCAFTGCRLPLRLIGDGYIDSEAFPLLHPLDVGLEATHQFVDELVSGDVFGGIGVKLLVLLLVTRLCVLVDYTRLGTEGVNALSDHSCVAVFEVHLGGLLRMVRHRPL